MIKTIINTENIKDADVVIVSAAYEKTASSHKGTINGPRSIIEQLDTQIEFFDRKFKKNVNDFVKIGHQDLGDIEKLDPAEAAKKIKENCDALVEAEKFVFLLGGEHSVTLGLLTALANKYNPSETTILQIDAHCDLRDNDSDYSEHSSNIAHSTVMRRASELGFNIVQAGIRTYSKEEYDYFSNPKNKVTVFEWGNKAMKKKPTTEEILESIKTKYLYLTIDVDGFDPSFMPGTGTPVQGGLKWWYGVELIENVIASKELIGADIVEVSPIPDSTLTEYGAAQLCHSVIANKFKQKLQ